MKRKFILLLALLLSVGSVSAKTSTTVLWEGTDDGSDIMIPKGSLVAGATITLTFDWLTSDGAQFSCFYWNGSNWAYLYDWEWVNNGDAYSFSLTQDQIDAIPYQLGFKTNALNKMKISKIIITEDILLTSTGDNLLDANWAVVENWESRNFDALAGAKIGDVILIDVTTSDWGYNQVQVRDREGNVLNNESSYLGNFAGVNSDVFEYEIDNLSDLKKIQSTGFRINASKNTTITSIKLLSYADSYGYVTISIGETGYATWSSDKKYDFSSAGLTAYYASAVAEGTVTLTSMDVTWDWQGYIIKGAAGEYDVLQSLTADGSYYPSTNYLKYHVGEGTVAASESGDANFRYILAIKAGDASSMAFYKLTSDHNLAANKAYLETPTDITPTAGARGINLVFEDETTGISSAELVQPRDEAIYTLSGMRVNKPARGLYITGGRKVFVK